jgi:hypothetical protein
VLLCDPHVASQRALQTAAHRVAIDRRNDYKPRILERLESSTETRRCLARILNVSVGESVQVGAGAEELGPSPVMISERTCGCALSFSTVSCRASNPSLPPTYARSSAIKGSIDVNS